MTSSLSLLGLIVLAFAVTTIESRAVPHTDTVMPLMLDMMGNPVMILRDKRASYYGYPSRTMMFTGFYRPPRRSGSSSQATSIYAEGNAIGGGAYFSQPINLGDGPDPVEDGDVSRAEAEARPGSEEDEHHDGPVRPQDNETNDHSDEEHKQPAEKPSKGQKKGKMMPVEEEDEDEYDDDKEEDYRSTRPKGRKYRPSSNNYFPMVFSFPGSTARRGSSGAGSGGPITAVANSYSTGKGGVASSVATAYGGMPMKKPRRRYSSSIN